MVPLIRLYRAPERLIPFSLTACCDHEFRLNSQKYPLYKAVTAYINQFIPVTQASSPGGHRRASAALTLWNSPLVALTTGDSLLYLLAPNLLRGEHTDAA